MSDILTELERGTLLVRELAEGRISIGSFLREYGDFYHYLALDGHEGEIGRIDGVDDLDTLIGLHARVQDIAYQVYDSDAPIPAYVDVGRILPSEAETRIASVAREFDVASLLRQVQRAVSAR